MNVTVVLIALAAVVEVVLLGWSVVTALLEQASLARFVRAAADPERLRDVAMQLPGAYRAPATQLAGELARRGSLDDVVSQAVAKTANTTFGLSPLQRILSGLILAIVVFSPLAAALVDAAHSIDDAKASAEAFVGSRVFLAAKARVEPAFADLHAAFQNTAVLLAGLIIVASVNWWLNRPEAREARFVKAILEAAIAARPGASAPVSGRLTQLLAPDRSLALPIAAFGFFFVALVAGWLLLYATAGVKEANAADVYDVWPPERQTREPLTSPLGMTVPAFNGGGSPVKERSFATLAIGPTKVEVAGELLVELAPKYLLGDTFPKDAIEGDRALERVLAGFRKGAVEIDVNLLGHSPVPMTTVMRVFDHVRTHHKVRRAVCILSRGLESGTSEKQRIPAGIHLQLAPPEGAAKDIAMAIEGQRVIVDPGTPEAAEIDRNDARWRGRLTEAVRKRVLNQADGQAWVALSVKGADLTYEQFLEVLATADSTCPSAMDCGVPGLGLRFFFEKPETK